MGRNGSTDFLSFAKTTADGRNPAPPGMYKTLQINGIDYQPQLVQDFFHQQYVCCVISGGTTKETKPFGGVRGENSNGGADSIAKVQRNQLGKEG